MSREGEAALRFIDAPIALNTHPKPLRTILLTIRIR